MTDVAREDEEEATTLLPEDFTSEETSKSGTWLTWDAGLVSRAVIPWLSAPGY